jgi:protein-S-isoprenylcysteine O-methyltransferase Ste14
VRPLPFVWPYALVFWAVFIWAFGIESMYMRRAVGSGGARSAQDAGSMWTVVILNYIGTFLAILAAFRLPTAVFPNRVVVFWLGIVVLIAGSLLRRHCFRMLGQYFTYDVRVREEQPIIERGAYRWIRHPSYSAGVLMFVGLGLAFGNWISLLILTFTVVVGYMYRVRVEERALLASMGDRYRDYMRRTRRFIPFVI